MSSFDWLTVLDKDGIKCAPVSSFQHVAMYENWDALITLGLKVEVKNRDVGGTNSMKGQDCYWIASVVKIAGTNN